MQAKRVLPSGFFFRAPDLTTSGQRSVQARLERAVGGREQNSQTSSDRVGRPHQEARTLAAKALLRPSLIFLEVRPGSGTPKRGEWVSSRLKETLTPGRRFAALRRWSRIIFPNQTIFHLRCRPRTRALTDVEFASRDWRLFETRH